MSLVSDVYFLSARPPLKSSTVSLVTVSRRGSPPRLPLLKVLWSVLRTITTLDRGWLNSWPCIVGGIIANDWERGPPTRGDLKQIIRDCRVRGFASNAPCLKLMLFMLRLTRRPQLFLLMNFLWNTILFKDACWESVTLQILSSFVRINSNVVKF